MNNTLKARYWAWYNKRIVPGFYKSIAWLASVSSLLLSYGPDVATLLLEHMDLIQTALPALPDRWKAVVLIVGHGIVFFFRPVRQRNMPQPTLPVAVVNVPNTVDIDTGRGNTVSVPTEVVEIERQKTSPGPL